MARNGRSDLQRPPRQAATSARTAEPADVETRFRALVQSPLRAGILRYLSARPEENFDVESLMQTFGRLTHGRRKLRPRARGLRRGHAIAGTPSSTWRRGRSTTRWPSCSTTSSNAARPCQHRRSVALGAALPRDDRPRRENADRVRMDPHGGQVRHLGADSRADRVGQRSGGPDDSRAQPRAASRSFRR